jgi:hypothetical protein
VSPFVRGNEVPLGTADNPTCSAYEFSLSALNGISGPVACGYPNLRQAAFSCGCPGSLVVDCSCCGFLEHVGAAILERRMDFYALATLAQKKSSGKPHDPVCPRHSRKTPISFGRRNPSHFLTSWQYEMKWSNPNHNRRRSRHFLSSGQNEIKWSPLVFVPRQVMGRRLFLTVYLFLLRGERKQPRLS